MNVYIGNYRIFHCICGFLWRPQLVDNTAASNNLTDLWDTMNWQLPNYNSVHATKMNKTDKGYLSTKKNFVGSVL